MTTTVTDAPEWSRLSPRVIWVDLALTVLSLVPALVALALSQSEASSGVVWPLVIVASWGALGAVGDAVRWLFTHYRVTASHVELRTGVIFRQHRSVRRERVRSVDIEAKLRHRATGLRMVEIGAGQQAAAGESAFTLDALSREDAHSLRTLLLGRNRPESAEDATAATAGHPTSPDTPLRVFATLRPQWVVYNMFNIWAYLMALGVISGAWGITSLVGADPVSIVADLYDWSSLGWPSITVAVVVGVSLLGWIGLTANFFTEFWGFELARVPGPDGTQLRTRKGLFTTHEVNRDENRVRGVQISEPLVWRWLGVTDTHVITTGLDMNSMSDPAAVLPRVHRDLARRTAAGILDEDASLFDIPLRPHPKVALWRRLWWATLLTAGITAVLGVLVSAELLPVWVLRTTPPVWALTLVGALIAYRTLGHAEHGPYLIIRSGLFNRATVILRRDAVSTIAVSESLLQRWLGLRTVSVMTAAGHEGYDLPDVGAAESTALAGKAAPGVLQGFTVDGRA